MSDIAGSDKLVALEYVSVIMRAPLSPALSRSAPTPAKSRGGKRSSLSTFVVNIEPRKMRGVASEGMLFDIGFADGVRPVLAVPESALPDGCRTG